MKKTIAIILTALTVFFAFPVSAEELENMEDAVNSVTENTMTFDCKSAVLMEATTGKILFEQNAEESFPPASVTKVMTLLLLMEAIDDGRISLEDNVTVSATAASMGGSQVYLKEGEKMKLEDLLKCVVIASANDAAVALAEYLYGSVSMFVEKMNEKAEALGMAHTTFENVTGLDDTAQSHFTSALDIAIMSKELISHKKILEYSSIWMDTIREGAFGLTNTNRLVRFYPGCTGLKTGSTSKAGFCISVTAQRNGLSLICVIMGAESRDIRNAAAVSLLDWGFANFALFTKEAAETSPLKVIGGTENTCIGKIQSFSCVVPKNDLSKVSEQTVLPDSISAPIYNGDEIGKTIYYLGEEEIGSSAILCEQTIEKIGFFDIVKKTVFSFLLI